MGMYLASPWPRQGLFFLNDALRHGGSFAEIASFLCRDEDEVREKARELKLIGPASVWPFDHDGGADHVGRSPLPSRTPRWRTRAASFDHLVGAGEQCWRDIETPSQS